MGRKGRPDAQEHAEYYRTYIDLVGDGDILTILAKELDRTRQLLGRVPSGLEGYRYEAGKWSVRDVVGHLIDAERVFTYRAMSFARGDAGPLPGMEQVGWADEARADETPLPELAREFAAVRASTIGFYSRLDPQHMVRKGMASGVEFTVRALVFIIAGHEIHHRGILEDRYGLGEL